MRPTLPPDVGVDQIVGVLPVEKGGTGADADADARTNLGAAEDTHTHAASDIASGTLAVARGGTGQSTEQAAIDALTGAAEALEGDVLTRDADGSAVFTTPAGG